MNIIRGTTPTIVYNFKTVKTTDLSEAIITLVKDGATVLEKDMTSATTDQTALSWTLTQEETLQLSGAVSVMLNWLTVEGVRGASHKTSLVVDSNYHAEVMGDE